MLTFTTFASGSLGNAALVSCGDTHILLDAGISAKRLSAGLREMGVNPASLAGIFLTHEHADHVSGLRVFSSKAAAPIYATRPTLWAWYKKNRCDGVKALFRPQAPGTGVQAGPLWVESFPTPHDAAQSVGWSVTDGEVRLVLCTDLGWLSPEVRQAVRGCDLLVCETNHDEDWVRTGPYTYALKQRILGDCGQLSNEAGAELAAQAVRWGARAVVLAHLSQTNNTPARAYEAAALRLMADGVDPERDISLSVAPTGVPGPVFRLERGAVRVLPREEAALC